MEGARFRNRVLDIARDALGQFRLDLELTQPTTKPHTY